MSLLQYFPTQSTKRSLIELISNLELGLDTGDDGDSDGFGFSDHEASLVEGGHGGFEGARSGSAMMAYGPGKFFFGMLVFWFNFHS